MLRLDFQLISLVENKGFQLFFKKRLHTVKTEMFEAKHIAITTDI